MRLVASQAQQERLRRPLLSRRLPRAPHMTRVKGGSKGRYVLRSGPGEGPWSPCFNVEIKRLWMLSASVPRFLYGGDYPVTRDR